MSRIRTLTLFGALTAAAAGLACSGESVVSPSALAGDLRPVANSAGDGAGSSSLSSGGRPESAHVSNQGGMGVYAPNGASIVRQPNGLQARVSMPLPQPGTYNYPAGYTAGHPEVFTLWIFVFNHPELCSVPCGMDDLGVDKPARGGVYNGGGHVASGNRLTIAGRVGVGQEPFDHPVIDMDSLQLPATAQVHLAIAPHGGLDPSTLPNEFRIPTGTPAFWWIAIFD